VNNDESGNNLSETGEQTGDEHGDEQKTRATHERARTNA
jgi:hypothetical protein